MVLIAYLTQLAIKKNTDCPKCINTNSMMR